MRALRELEESELAWRRVALPADHSTHLSVGLCCVNDTASHWRTFPKLLNSADMARQSLEGSSGTICDGHLRRVFAQMEYTSMTFKMCWAMLSQE
jgi:hypothetical protein